MVTDSITTTSNLYREILRLSQMAGSLRRVHHNSGTAAWTHDLPKTRRKTDNEILPAIQSFGNGPERNEDLATRIGNVANVNST